MINVLFKRGQSDDEIVDVLVNPNHISAHVLSEPENPQKYGLAECDGREARASERI